MTWDKQAGAELAARLGSISVMVTVTVVLVMSMAVVVL